MNVLVERIASAITWPARSAWDRGVKAYGLELLNDLDEAVAYGLANGWDELEALIAVSSGEIEKTLLNGATDWVHYSRSGSALIYDADICGYVTLPS